MGPSSSSLPNPCSLKTPTQTHQCNNQLTFTPPGAVLIEHPSGRNLLFDLGVRKDWQNWSPTVLEALARIPGAGNEVRQGVREQLEEHGVPGSSIEAVIWSHWHFDHTGDPSTFDPHTALIVGPGFRDAFLPGYPAGRDSPVLESDYEGRELREVCFKDPGAGTGIITRVGRFDALDYFGDGSFYILDAPGHAVGHLCALARVSTAPDSFILMGGDAAHHGGEVRPSEYMPLPESISPNPLAGSPSSPSSSPSSSTPCPGAVFEHLLRGGRGGDRTKPFLGAARGGIHADVDELEETIGKIQEADAHDRVLVVLAHDRSLLPVLDFFPKYASDFASKDWVEKGRWAFLKDFKEALE